MKIQMPLSKKVTLVHDSTIQTDPHDNSDDFKWFPFYFVIMMPNIVGTISKAIRRHDYSLMILCASVSAGFFLLQFCLIKYISLPKNDKLSLKFLLKLNMWFLYSAISSGFVYQFSDFFPSEITLALYGVVLVCSSFLLYLFVIVDLVRFWKIWRYGEDETEVPENQTFVAGKLNRYSISILEKV
ncbi:hypothetical protein L6452_41582 [Arctium lappa]|uniref:Uncharacterized protein n=1 Tax=Arctium lappa TaxID=4217 RepID=A0ACB8XQC7_ARCLA|nr:hypothetical protein L6452_41582 [Arctium lappa]